MAVSFFVFKQKEKISLTKIIKFTKINAYENNCF